MSRRRIAALLAFGALFALPSPGLAQDGATGSPPDRIDIKVPPPAMRSTEEECERRSEAAVISGEIVVCGSRPGETSPRYSSNEEAENRYAAATQGRGPVQLPELGIFRGPATVSGICVPGIFNCPKPPAVFVDVRALPQAPPGSDADRIARGLAPLGVDTATRPGLTAEQRAELGLPPPPAAAAPQRAPVSREESAAPAAPR